MGRCLASYDRKTDEQFRFLCEEEARRGGQGCHREPSQIPKVHVGVELRFIGVRILRSARTCYFRSVYYDHMLACFGVVTLPFL